MPVKDWIFTIVVTATISAVAGWAVWVEYKGYCISEPTCTAGR